MVDLQTEHVREEGHVTEGDVGRCPQHLQVHGEPAPLCATNLENNPEVGTSCLALSPQDRIPLEDGWEGR